jgi:hypothetical protein
MKPLSRKDAPGIGGSESGATKTREKESSGNKRQLSFHSLHSALFLLPFWWHLFDLPRACMTNGCDEVSRAFHIVGCKRSEKWRRGVVPALGFDRKEAKANDF